MRPALTRLLNRPSSILLLENLIRPISTLDVSINHGGCLRCDGNRRRTLLGNTTRHFQFEHNANVHRNARRPQRDNKKPGHGSCTSSRQFSQDNTVVARHKKLQKLNFEELLFESDIGHEFDVGSRLVDLPEHREDFELWLQLLNFQRDNGDKHGIIDIWKGMMIRCRDLELPVTGHHADEIWSIFLKVGFEDKGFLETIFRYAQWLWKEKGKRWPKLYSTILREYLEKRPDQAWGWHVWLRDDHLLSPNDIRSVFPWKNVTGNTMHIFKCIYYDVRPMLYSNIVPRLCKENMFEEAVRWHEIFVRLGDLPSKQNHIILLIKYLERIGDQAKIDEINRNLTASGFHTDSSRMLKTAPSEVLTDEKMTNILSGDEHNHSPKTTASYKVLTDVTTANASSDAEHKHSAKKSAPYRVHTDDKSANISSRDEYGHSTEDKSDGFYARLFATGSLNFSVVLMGLQMFGIKALGPTSIRQIAISAGSPETLDERFRQLKDANIDVGQSAFVRLMQKLARAKDGDMLQAVLKSDQHPDALEDWKLQEQLLAQSQRKGNSGEYQRTIAVLTVDADSDETVWNLHLRCASSNRDRSAVTRIIENMQAKKIAVTSKTIAWLYFTTVPERGRGRRPRSRTPEFDWLGYLITLWQGLLQSNLAQIRAYHWRDVIKRLGMAGRWADLEALIRWLASWYAPIEAESADNPPIPPQSHLQGLKFDPSHPFDKRQEWKALLHPQLQHAIVEWGFIHPYRLRNHIDTKSPSIHPKSRQGYNPKRVFGFRSTHTFMPWTRGLVLLKDLSAHGIEPDTPSIREVCRHRLRYLYGSLDPLLMNRPRPRMRVQRMHEWPLRTFLIDAETVWEGLFTDFEPEEGKGTWAHQLVNPAQRPSTKRKWKKKKSLMEEGGPLPRDYKHGPGRFF